MKPLERILVPVDLSPVSEELVKLAGRLALRYNSELVLFHAIDSLIVEHVAAGFNPDKVIMELEQKAKVKLGELKKILDDMNVPATIYDEIPVDDPAIAINNAAVKAGATEIIIAKRGWRLRRFSLIGSTTKELIKIARVPVIVYHSYYDRELKKPAIMGDENITDKLLVTVDRNTTRELIEYSINLAFYYESEEIYVLHVIEEGESDETYNKILEEIINNFKSRVPGKVRRILLKGGKIGKIIVKMAESLETTIIAGRTLVRSPLEYILGTTLDHIIKLSTRPVIVYPIHNPE